MKIQKEIPPFIKYGAWALSLITFIVGFWHTHLGLKQIHFFNSDYGSLAIAGIVLILLLISYWYAINITKWAIIVYIICGSFFFVFNLNYFYPAYLARTLVIDEARVLKDTLQTYANSADKLYQISDGGKTGKMANDISNLISYKNQIESEIKFQHGFGPSAREKLDLFNEISGKHNVVPIKPSMSIGNTGTTDSANSAIALLSPQLASAIQAVQEDIRTHFNSESGSEQLNQNLANGIDSLKRLKIIYTPKLDAIIIDNTPIDLESVEGHPQVLIIKKFVQDLNQACSMINKSSIYILKLSSGTVGKSEDERGKIIFPELRKEDFPRADKLGTIKHTITSIKERVHEIDTWAIILVCLFIDLLVPLAMYMFLRKREGEEEKPKTRDIGKF